MDEGLLGEGNKQRGHPTTAGPAVVSTAPRLRAKEQPQHVGTCSAMCTQVQHVSITSELPAAMSIKPFSHFCIISEEFAFFLKGVHRVPRHSSTTQTFLGFSNAPILEHKLIQTNIAFY